MKLSFLFLTSSLFFAQNVLAEAPRVGRDAAARYFQREPSQEVAMPAGPRDHYLALHIGKFMNGQSWEWGRGGRVDDTGGMSFGVTYRLYEYSNSSDVALRVDFNDYKAVGEKPLKMSLMPMFMFPDANSRFPLYFGAGAGLGVFFKQVKDESALSFDYQLIAGARFFDVFENTGFFFETGLKNHVLLTTSGQFNGVFLSGGAVFTF
ncbi:MAG: hypothetical protein KF802_13885 [Bdellovibrionaceae bacterium]|nr:hypothetical protein [Pseudobdellovibrionaceae bacterium]MBX3033118.1 hypothetical protein [Pseudobdellovibrionaceae bacterium]